MTYYAHSGRHFDNGRVVPPQTYADHVNGMLALASPLMGNYSPMLQKALYLAIFYHDMGKLIPENQVILGAEDTVDAPMVHHADTGVAYCLQRYGETQDVVWIHAAELIKSHHAGLPDRENCYQITREGWNLYFHLLDGFRDFSVQAYNEAHLGELAAKHFEAMGAPENYQGPEPDPTETLTATDTRMAMALVAYCDHTDTANHYYSFGRYRKTLTLQPTQRREKLAAYIQEVQAAKLAQGESIETLASRNALLEVCRQLDLSEGKHFYSCAAPTGKGKTLALMELALRLAEQRQRKHIHVIVPYTNIISQSVQTYRNLCLPGESPVRAINEIHSKVEYESPSLGVYSHMWDAPINVSTSVQFFDSLFSNRPAALKKLVRYANSVVILDEYHTTLPAGLWETALSSMAWLAQHYGMDFVFGSGTHVHYWDIYPNGGVTPEQVVDVVPDALFSDFQEFEHERVRFLEHPGELTDTGFYQLVESRCVAEGKLQQHTLVVMNTTRNAALVARHFQSTHPEWLVYHLSAGLTPRDREVVLQEVRERLTQPQKIMLVATPIIDCGVDVSFEIGFREKGSMASVIQMGGRVNRSKTLGVCDVIEFTLNHKALRELGFTQNPALRGQIGARGRLPVDPMNCTSVAEREKSYADSYETTCASLLQMDSAGAFKTMAEHFHVIQDETVGVVVDKEVWDRMQAGEEVSPVEITRNSVTRRKSQLEQDSAQGCIQVEEVSQDEIIYHWIGPYDSQFGIYAELF